MRNPLNNSVSGIKPSAPVSENDRKNRSVGTYQRHFAGGLSVRFGCQRVEASIWMFSR